jgi:hypothetical protein
MSIPYRSISELNVDKDINKSLIVTQEKTNRKLQPIYKLTSKEKNKNTKRFNEDAIIQKLENTFRKDIEEREKKQNDSFKKIKEEKEKLEKEKRDLLIQMERQKSQYDSDIQNFKNELEQTQSELDNLKRPKYPKSRDTSYMSAAFDDYENLMNKADENVNKILYQYKPFNEEKDYTLVNRRLSLLAQKREDARKKKEEETIEDIIEKKEEEENTLLNHFKSDPKYTTINSFKTNEQKKTSKPDVNIPDWVSYSKNPNINPFNPNNIIDNKRNENNPFT